MRSLSPGAFGGRLNYTLTEKALGATMPAQKVLDARTKVTQKYSADVLGVRGSSWDISVEPDRRAGGKYCRGQADARLSNTLRPEHINAGDFRGTKTAFQPASTAPAEFNRHTAEWAASGSGWNTSTVKASPEEAERMREALLATCKAQNAAKTQRLTQAMGYVGPVERHVRAVETARERKANSMVDYGALVAEYGDEGADAMLHITELNKAREQRAAALAGIPPRCHASRPRVPKQDLQDVADLPGASDDEGTPAGAAAQPEGASADDARVEEA
ncbi:hypothetical protein FOA52_011893 [Chlamydomonas sp. UWO 241]|nr:hypothetical protein FOA52_011893 [Chlamydomonas sp. UWO 241]